MKKILGIELGSTRIKAVLINERSAVLAEGSYEWENSLVGGLWSYALEDIDAGLQASFASLSKSYATKFGEPLESVDAIGISAMMHGYLAFDKNDKLLVPFRTWRNTNTSVAANELCEKFDFNVPMRWSVSHYYHAVLMGEEHVGDVDFLTTLSGYIHYRLSGKRVLGIGDASGMFPVLDGNYDKKMLNTFNEMLRNHGIERPFESVLPRVLLAGEDAGNLTEDGAALLDPSGTLRAGAPMCPPEGDGGTGMVATNCVMPKSANVSAGTSAFLMAVLDDRLRFNSKDIDVVCTPHGKHVAMVHVNNFTSEMTAWANLFEQVIALSGGKINRGDLFEALYNKSLEADADVGGLVGYNFVSSEPFVGAQSGGPMIARTPTGKLTLANFMKASIYSALGSFAMVCEILAEKNVIIKEVCGHGGFFKTPFVGQSAMSAAVGAPITVMKNAGEGGAWGIALLALFRISGVSDLERFLAKIFESAEKTTVSAGVDERASFAKFLEKYKACLPSEVLLTELIK